MVLAKDMSPAMKRELHIAIRHTNGGMMLPVDSARTAHGSDLA
jgi:hypothetical protein